MTSVKRHRNLDLKWGRLASWARSHEPGPQEQPRDLSAPSAGVLDSEGPSSLPDLVCARLRIEPDPKPTESKGKEPSPQPGAESHDLDSPQPAGPTAAPAPFCPHRTPQGRRGHTCGCRAGRSVCTERPPGRGIGLRDLEITIVF